MLSSIQYFSELHALSHSFLSCTRTCAVNGLDIDAYVHSSTALTHGIATCNLFFSLFTSFLSIVYLLDASSTSVSFIFGISGSQNLRVLNSDTIVSVTWKYKKVI